MFTWLLALFAWVGGWGADPPLERKGRVPPSDVSIQHGGIIPPPSVHGTEGGFIPPSSQ